MEELVPIVLFLVIGVVISLYCFFRYRYRVAVQATVRGAVERGQDLTPELLEAIGGINISPDQDLRRGLIWLALGLATATASQLVEPDLLAIAAFPLFVSVAYIALWRFTGRKRD